MQLAELGVNAPSSLTSVILGDSSTAILILLAMGFGLITPKFVERALSLMPKPALDQP